MSVQETFAYSGGDFTRGYNVDGVALEVGRLTLPHEQHVVHALEQPGPPATEMNPARTTSEVAERVANVIHVDFLREVVSASLEPDHTSGALPSVYDVVPINLGESPSNGGNFTPVQGLRSPLVDALRTGARPEKVRKPVRKLRPTTPDDIKAMVEIDIRSFGSVYENYDLSPEQLRTEMTEKFVGRFEKVGADWNPVYEKDGEVDGFMMNCPTSKKPEDFESWEKTTDNGTLKTTYDPNGPYIYIVSLDMEGCGETARNMIFMDQIGKMIEGGFEKFYFESRLPGLRDWMQEQCVASGIEFDELDQATKHRFAETYYTATKTNSKGKEVPLDHLIRIYSGVGCEFIKLAPDAYMDEPSMNYGAVGVFHNPLPKLLRNNRTAKKILGRALRKLAHSPRLAERMF